MTMNPVIPGSERAAAARWPLIDVARGLALAAMIVYHFAWDLSHYRIIATDIVRDPGWSLFAKTIASSFMFLVGVGFALGGRAGLDRARYLRRLGMIAGAAALVTLGTLVAAPEAPVLFGILHCIALASVLILPFLRAPIAAALVAAVIVFALPPVARSAVFDGAGWVWLGLGERFRPAVDYVPILPWVGFTLLGLAAGRALVEWNGLKPARDWIAAWRSASPPARLLALMGRWSLLIYLTHQIILMAALYPFQPTQPQPAALDDAASFRSACEQNCRATNASAETCQTFCNCAVSRLRPTPIWSRILRDEIAPADQSTISDVTKQCAADAKIN
ncbi:MAG: DUF1624 domain-containing protein [Rhizobiales bacterium]|nr:DUF1624 domain-containing protein [Hyphomicrobiales bacterium]